MVEKVNYGTSIRTNGTVARVLTRSAEHARGFKVMLKEGGVVGRRTQLIEKRAASRREAPITRRASADAADLSSDEYLASIDLSPPTPRQRLRDART